MLDKTKPSPKGITAQATNAKIKVSMGANTNRILLAPEGIMVSFKNNLTPSAMGCKSPKGPTILGPLRNCIQPITLRSAKVR